MRSIFLLVPVFILMACNSKTAKMVKKDSVSIDSGGVLKTNEFLDPFSLRINNQLLTTANLKDVEALMGKPDSVISTELGCDNFDSGSKLVYFGWNMFEHRKDSTSQLRSMNFLKNKKYFLQAGKLKLSSETTFEELKKLFPESFKDVSIITMQEIPGEIQSVRVQQTPDNTVDGAWILMFQNGKLIRIDDWFPC